MGVARKRLLEFFMMLSLSFGFFWIFIKFH